VLRVWALFLLGYSEQNVTGLTSTFSSSVRVKNYKVATLIYGILERVLVIAFFEGPYEIRDFGGRYRFVDQNPRKAV